MSTSAAFRGIWEGRVVARFRRQRGAAIGVVLLTVLVLLALIGPTLAGASPDESDFVRGASGLGLPAGPSSAHWLGTDALYRDELARLAHGARLSLSIAVSATALSSIIGALVGMIAGYVAGTSAAIVDSMLMRFVDVMLSFPYLLLVMAIGAALDRTSSLTVLLVLGLTSWLGTARLIRAKTMQVREKAFVEASRALGQHASKVIALHVLPNVAGPLIVISTISMSSMILAESVLSYLQVGIQPPEATWGRMLYEGQHHFTIEPRLVIAPGIAILASALGFSLVGEALREALEGRETR